MLDAVYVDTKDGRRIVAIRAKAPFRAVFQVATTREGAEVALVHDSEGAFENSHRPPPGGYGAEADSCSWWRRGRVELPVQETLPLGCTTGLAGELFLAPLPLYRRRSAREPTDDLRSPISVYRDSTSNCRRSFASLEVRRR